MNANMISAEAMAKTFGIKPDAFNKKLEEIIRSGKSKSHAAWLLREALLRGDRAFFS